MSKDDIVINNVENSNKNTQSFDSLYASLFTNNHSITLLINPETGAIVDANSKMPLL